MYHFYDAVHMMGFELKNSGLQMVLDKDVPEKIWKEIYKIISKLYYHDIHYVDISPFNFMVDKNDKVYIIDFGDAYECKVNWFLKDFIDGEKSWNSDFA